MAHACNPSSLRGGGRIAGAQEQETLSLQKKKSFKIILAWWYAPVVPVAQEAEVGGSPEPQEVEAVVSYDHTTAPHPRCQSEALYNLTF